MKRLLILACASLIAATSLLAQTPSTDLPSAIPPSRAKVYIEETEFDYGYMPNDASVSHSYWLRSVGEDSLKILRVKPACGCTKAPLTKEVVAPRDSAAVELIFHASAGQRGNVSKTATVTCNDNNKGNFILKFSAKMYATEFPDSLTPLTLSQSMIKWDQNSKSQEQRIVLKNVSAQPINISMISAPDGFADVEQELGEIKPGKTRELSFKVDRGFTGQEFQKSLTFACNDVNRTRYSIPVVMSAQIAAVAPPLQKATPASAEGSSQGGGSH